MGNHEYLTYNHHLDCVISSSSELLLDDLRSQYLLVSITKRKALVIEVVMTSAGGALMSLLSKSLVEVVMDEDCRKPYWHPWKIAKTPTQSQPSS